MTCTTNFHAWAVTRTYSAVEMFPIVSAKTPDSNGDPQEVIGNRVSGHFVFAAGIGDILPTVSSVRISDEYLRPGKFFLKCRECGAENHSVKITPTFHPAPA